MIHVNTICYRVDFISLFFRSQIVYGETVPGLHVEKKYLIHI